jgi:hypothetical protein
MLQAHIANDQSIDTTGESESELLFFIKCIEIATEASQITLMGL